MAASTKKPAQSSKKKALIDPIYKKYIRSVVRALGSTDFYEFFMDSIARANNEFQFSNRKLIKTVDVNWVDAIDSCMEAFQRIIVSPRNIIHEEELIVNVAHARKGGADVVRHLASHASLVEKYDEDTGDVRPSKLMQKYREDAITFFENRLVFSVLESAHQFVRIRYDALFSVMSDEYGAKLKVKSDMETPTEEVHMDMFLHIKEIDGALETDNKNRDVFERISRIHRLLTVYMNSPFAQQLAKLPRVRGSISKTNVLKKNPDYHKIMLLGEYLRDYTDIGYTIKVVEQNPTINETFTGDIFHTILFNYLILKGYLEDEEDRTIPAAKTKTKKRTLKPKFIHEIIEELTEDYDLPDVEIRKVLIEELTKEQLMQEEAAERRRLVEEQAERKRQEAEQARKEREAEKERIRKEKEAEKERQRLEKEAEEQRRRQEQMEREIEDRRRSKIFLQELERFTERLPGQLEAREKAAAKEAKGRKDFEDAARLMEEAEQRKQEAQEREKKRAQEARDRIRREKALAKERADREERERLERERLAKEAEEERLRLEEEARQAEIRREREEQEERLRQEQDARDTKATREYAEQLTVFFSILPQRIAQREEETEQARRAREEWEQARRNRLAKRPAGVK